MTEVTKASELDPAYRPARPSPKPLPPRFRASDTARPMWLANVAIINALRQIPSFAGSVTSMVNDNQADSIPEVLSIDVYEDSASGPRRETTGDGPFRVSIAGAAVDLRQRDR